MSAETRCLRKKRAPRTFVRVFAAMTRQLVALFKTDRKHGTLLLFLLFVIVFSSAIYGFWEEGIRTCKPVVWHEAVYYAIGLFTLAGNRFDYPQSAVLHVDYLVAPLISASALLGAFARVVEERAPLLFRRFRRHTVIGGLGKLGMILARHEQGRKKPFIAIEISERTKEVAAAKELDHGAVLTGDMTSLKTLKEARAHLARRVFFTSSSDVANLDAASHVRMLARKHKVKHPPEIFVHVVHPRLSESLALHWGEPRKADARIIPFNGYRFAARALFAKLVRDRHVRAMRVGGGLALARTDWPDHDGGLIEPEARDVALEEDRRRLFAAFRVEEETESAERFAIVGLGRLGSELVDNLLRHAGREARFLLVDRAKSRLEEVLNRAPPEARPRFATYAGDVMAGRGALREIEAFAPTAAIVCTDSDLGNLRLALDLQAHGVRTVARMFDADASPELVEELGRHAITAASFARLLHAAIPILTNERRLLACVNLDVAHTPIPDHLFYLAEMTEKERSALGRGCVGLDELPRTEGVRVPSPGLVLVWHRAIEKM